MSDINQQYRTYKYRILPSKKQHLALARICESQREIYNAALEERIDCYRKTGKSRSYVDQCKGLTELREDPEFSAIPLSIQRWTIKRVDDAYNAFFRRLKTNGKAGFPRFRGKGWWKAFGFRTLKGLRFDGRRLRFKGMPGGLRIHMHRPLDNEAVIKSLVFRRDPKGWIVCLQCAVPASTMEHSGAAVGLHIGRVTCATLSTGEDIPAPQLARRAEKEARRRQRALQRSRDAMRQRGNTVTNGYLKRKRAYERQQQRIADARRTHQHQQTARIAKEYGLIAVESIGLDDLVKRNRDKPRGVYIAAWGQFIDFLSYKAERAGGKVIRVPSGDVSVICSGCGARFVDNPRARTLRCEECGFTIKKTTNVALNVLALAVTGQGRANAAGNSKRPAGRSATEG